MTRTKTRRPRGTGSLYKRGRLWWVQYVAYGKLVQESSQSTSKREAEDFLARRLGEVKLAVHRRTPDSVTFEDLADRVRTDYVDNRHRSAGRLDRALRRLAGTFAGMPAATITAARIRAYSSQRHAAGAAPGTIRIELAALKRAFRLLVAEELLPRVPAFPKVRPAPAREGFFEDAEIEALAAELPAYLVPVLRFGALTGWRVKEITGLTWDRVDFDAGMMRLEARHTKGAAAREFPFGALPELAELLRIQANAALGAEIETGRRSPWVFFRRTQQGPKPIRDHYHAWRSACSRAGLPGRLFHDLRRTAVRNLERAGVSRSVAMQLTGHKTESVYRRYAITNTEDLRAGVAKRAAYTAVKLQSASNETP